MAKAKIVDAHAHLGEYCVFRLMATDDEKILWMEECGFDFFNLRWPGE